MGLSLVWGPPNAGRVGEVLGGFRETLPRDPVLVVPNADDAELFEQELASDGSLLGGSVSTFGGLMGEVARSLDVPWGPGLSRSQNVWLARAAVARTELSVLRRSGRPRGRASLGRRRSRDLHGAREGGGAARAGAGAPARGA